LSDTQQTIKEDELEVDIHQYIDNYIAKLSKETGQDGPIAQSVPLWLDSIDYSHDPAYKPSKFALDFVNFIKLVNGSDGEENKTPTLHYKMLDKVSGSLQDICNLVHRGAAKTTIFGEYMILYIATFNEIPGFGEVPLGLYVSDSIENGVKNMRKNLEYRWNNSDFLKKYVPKARFTDIRWEFTNISGKTTIFKGYGAKTGVRGAKEMGVRPFLAILDDLISDEDARSETVISSIEDTVYKAVDYALHPKRRKIIWSGTPFNARDPLYKAVESGAWYVNVYPVCERFPCTKEEFRGSWEDRFDYDFVIKQYVKAKKAGKIDSFYQELMLQISSEDNMLVNPDSIIWFNRANLFRNASNYNFYLTTDFTTDGKKGNDFSSIAAWAISSNGNRMLIDLSIKKRGLDEQYEDLFAMAMKYKKMKGYIEVGIEIDGTQKAHIMAIKERMIRKNQFFTISKQRGQDREGILSRSGGNKLERFRTTAPLFESGRMWFANQLKNTSSMQELLNEIRHTSHKTIASKHDDGLDVISQIMLMPIVEPDNNKEYDEDSQNTFDENGVMILSSKAQEDYLFGSDEPEQINDKISSYIV